MKAALVQTLKALHQCAIDSGDWRNASQLLAWPDPIGAEEFGGDPDEMLMVHQFNTAMTDLRKTKLYRPQKSDDEGEAAEDEAPTTANTKHKKKCK